MSLGGCITFIICSGLLPNVPDDGDDVDSMIADGIAQRVATDTHQGAEPVGRHGVEELRGHGGGRKIDDTRRSRRKTPGGERSISPQTYYGDGDHGSRRVAHHDKQKLRGHKGG